MSMNFALPDPELTPPAKAPVEFAQPYYAVGDLRDVGEEGFGRMRRSVRLDRGGLDRNCRIYAPALRRSGLDRDAIIGATGERVVYTIDLSKVTGVLEIQFSGAGAGVITDGVCAIVFCKICQIILPKQGLEVVFEAAPVGIKLMHV